MKGSEQRAQLKRWHCFVVAALAVGLYSHPKCLSGEFVYDDGGTITGNPVTQELVRWASRLLD